jgi:hypothetical protein
MKNKAPSPTPVSRNTVLTGLCAFSLISGCASTIPHGHMSHTTFSQSTLPEAVKVPDGHKVVLETIGIGEITYECKAKAATAITPTNGSAFEWVFVGPQAKLNARDGKTIGKYFGPPATWESMDGSKITGAQLAVAPAAVGSIPLQLVKANPAQGTGQMVGVSYIQRVATQGGVAPVSACDASRLGAKNIVPYQADYIFWGLQAK